MSFITIPRVFGGTLILQVNLAMVALLPYAVIVTFRDGVALATFRDGRAEATFRDGLVEIGGH